jgi:hypothetical protein
MVGVQSRDHTISRIVKQRWADTNLITKTEMMRVIEKGFELLDRFTFIIKDRPAAANPARINRGPPSLSEPGSACIFFCISRPKPSE